MDDTQTTNTTAQATVIAAASAPAVGASTVQPAAAQAVVQGSTPRPLNQVHQELLAAKAKHADDLAAVQASNTVLGALSSEYHATLSWFAEQEKQIAADIDDMQSSAGSWLLKEIKKVV